MRTGKLNDFIIIEGLKTITNEYGEEENTIYTEKLRARCDVVNDSGNRELNNGEVFYSYNKTFILWDYMDKHIDEYDRIKYKDKYFRIITKDVVKETKTLYVKTEMVNE